MDAMARSFGVSVPFLDRCAPKPMHLILLMSFNEEAGGSMAESHLTVVMFHFKRLREAMAEIKYFGVCYLTSQPSEVKRRL